MSLFNTKFSHAQIKFSLTELDQRHQHPEEDPDAYMRRFPERVLDCCDLVNEEVLVDVCLHVMKEEYLISQNEKNKFCFPSFSRLMEASR